MIDTKDLPTTPSIAGVPRRTPEDTARVEKYLDNLYYWQMADEALLGMEGYNAGTDSSPDDDQRRD